MKSQTVFIQAPPGQASERVWLAYYDCVSKALLNGATRVRRHAAERNSPEGVPTVPLEKSSVKTGGPAPKDTQTPTKSAVRRLRARDALLRKAAVTEPVAPTPTPADIIKSAKATIWSARAAKATSSLVQPSPPKDNFVLEPPREELEPSLWSDEPQVLEYKCRHVPQESMIPGRATCNNCGFDVVKTTTGWMLESEVGAARKQPSAKSGADPRDTAGVACRFTPCSNPNCKYKHVDGQQVKGGTRPKRILQTDPKMRKGFNKK